MSDDLDYELDDIVRADTPEQIRALGDRLRLTILDLVLERAMTVSDLAERLGRARGTIAYHVDLLVDVGLLKVVRTRRVRAVQERYYGRAGRTIVFPGTPGEMPFLADVLADVDLEALSADDCAGEFTFRHARITPDRAREFVARLEALALEFTRLPRGGDVEFGLYLALFPTNRLVAPSDTDVDAPAQKSA